MSVFPAPFNMCSVSSTSDGSDSRYSSSTGLHGRDVEKYGVRYWKVQGLGPFSRNRNFKHGMNYTMKGIKSPSVNVKYIIRNRSIFLCYVCSKASERNHSDG